MTGEEPTAEAVALLQELGLKEYEARCFVALTQLSEGTAREISDISEVPRTRVYDATTVLEAQGLVEVHHSNPKRFRAVSIDEATRRLRQQNDTRIETLETQLKELYQPSTAAEEMYRQEVWTLADHEAIQTRTEELIAEAESEIVLLVVEEDLLTDELVERLWEAQDQGVTVIIGGATDNIIGHVERILPTVEVFKTGLQWLMGPDTDDEVAISRVLLVDHEALLISSFYPHTDETRKEQAIFAEGLTNGVIVLLRRVLATGLPTGNDTAN